MYAFGSFLVAILRLAQGLVGSLMGLDFLSLQQAFSSQQYLLHSNSVLVQLGILVKIIPSSNLYSWLYNEIQVITLSNRRIYHIRRINDCLT